MADTYIHSDGPMAERIRQADWGTTSLGPLERWPATLLALVNAMLPFPTPMQIFWGPERIDLYNDAMVPFVMGKHPAALGLPGHLVWQEAWPTVGAQIDEVFAKGTSFSFHNLALSLLIGGVLQDTYWTFTYSPVFAPDGSVAGLLNAAQNNTENVRAQQALISSEQRFRLLVERASVGIALGDTAGKLSYLNPALRNLLGYSAEEVERGDILWNNLTPPEFAQADARAVLQLQTRGVADPYEKVYLTRDGESVPLLIGASVIPVDETYGNSSDVAVFATDLGPQKRAEAALLQSEKLAAVGKLAASISHEINNPLEAVTNLIYIVRQDESISQASHDLLATADRELARVSQVASHTLRFHRQSTLPSTVQPGALFDEVLQLYGGRISNCNVLVHTDYEPEAVVTCYEGDIRQVLNNLVGNAIDAMRSGGSLTLRTRTRTRFSRGDSGVLFTVADNGSGIPDDVLRRIFEAFYTTKGSNGTGLGLWISSRIVHKHRGYLRVHSFRGKTHQGTVFHLWLPHTLASSAREAWHDEDIHDPDYDQDRHDQAPHSNA